MEADIVQGPIGKVAEYDVEFKGGKFVASLSAGEGMAQVSLSLNADKVISAIEKAIPGPIDDALLEVLKKALL